MIILLKLISGVVILILAVVPIFNGKTSIDIIANRITEYVGDNIKDD